jgi:hypothetical protein
MLLNSSAQRIQRLIGNSFRLWYALDMCTKSVLESVPLRGEQETQLAAISGTLHSRLSMIL